MAIRTTTSLCHNSVLKASFENHLDDFLPERLNNVLDYIPCRALLFNGQTRQ